MAAKVLLFGKWDTTDVTCGDQSVADYIPVHGKQNVFVPHTAGRYARGSSFKRVSSPILERLLNSLMAHGRNSGKKLMAIRIMKHTLELIHLITGKNPVQVVVDAVSKAGPREDSTRIGSAGVVRRQAVDVSPLRRVNQAIYLMIQGARLQSFRNLKSISECLADEIINAANDSQNSYAIKKKDEIERVAKANR